MARVVVKCVDAPGVRRPGQPRVPVGLYLKSYDPEAHDGEGLADWTPDKADAQVFDSAVEAVRLWKAVPLARPTRPSGVPNRPLTAYTIVTEPVP